MNRALRAGVAVAAISVFVAVCSFPAAADLTNDELQCQLATSLTVGKFIAGKMQCIASCRQNAYANAVAPTECVPPYGGETFGCVTSQESTGTGGIQSSCNQDCPECYTNGDCAADSQSKISDAEAHVEALASDVFCDDSGSADGLTLSEHKCQMTVAKFLSLFAAKKMKCYAHCRKGEVGGKIPPGDCTPAAADARTQLCISRLEEKVAFVIDRRCESGINPSAAKPECGSYPTTDGAGWVAAEEEVVDGMHPGLFCNDP